MKKYLRIIAVLMIVAMLMSMTACSGGGLGLRGDGKVTLKFTHMWPEHAQLMKELCQEYSAQNPNVVIKPAYVQYSKMEDTLKSSIVSGGLPDVFPPCACERLRFNLVIIKCRNPVWGFLFFVSRSYAAHTPL